VAQTKQVISPSQWWETGTKGNSYPSLRGKGLWNRPQTKTRLDVPIPQFYTCAQCSVKDFKHGRAMVSCYRRWLHFGDGFHQW
jgi:hypothetical protein